MFCVGVCGFKFSGDFFVEEFIFVKSWLLFFCFLVSSFLIGIVFFNMVFDVREEIGIWGVEICFIRVGELFLDYVFMDICEEVDWIFFNFCLEKYLICVSEFCDDDLGDIEVLLLE